MQGSGALLYYLPDGTRVIQEPSKQVWPQAWLSPGGVPKLSLCLEDPSLGLDPEPPSLLQEHCCYHGTVQGFSGSWVNLCACAGLR